MEIFLEFQHVIDSFFVLSSWQEKSGVKFWRLVSADSLLIYLLSEIHCEPYSTAGTDSC